MFRLLLQKIQRPTRRVSVMDTLDTRDIMNHIKGAIYIFMIEGKSYFTKTMVLNYLNEQIGWPNKSNTRSVDRFSDLFDKAVSAYLPCPQVRGGFSFTLKPSPICQFTDKVLRG